MKRSITIAARSPLGTLLSSILIALSLAFMGLNLLLMDPTVRSSFYASFQTVLAPGKPARSFTENLVLQLKAMDTPTLLTRYAVMILAGTLAVGILGWFLRGYRFRFLPQQQLVERREMWLVTPVWLLAWIVQAIPFVLALHGRGWIVDISWITALMLAGPPAILLAGYAAAPDFTLRRWFIKPLRRAVPLWPAAWIVLILALGIAGWIIAKLAGFWLTLKFTIPAGIALGVLLPPIVLILCWFLAPELFRMILYIPGWRTRIPFNRIKRIEVRSSGEGGAGGIGGTILTLTLKNESTWTLHRGSPRRLQRLGQTLAKMLHLERRDFVTWT